MEITDNVQEKIKPDEGEEELIASKTNNVQEESDLDGVLNIFYMMVRFLNQNRLFLNVIIFLELGCFFVAGWLANEGTNLWVLILILAIVLAFLAGTSLAYRKEDEH